MKWPTCVASAAAAVAKLTVLRLTKWAAAVVAATAPTTASATAPGNNISCWRDKQTLSVAARHQKLRQQQHHTATCCQQQQQQLTSRRSNNDDADNDDGAGAGRGLLWIMRMCVMYANAWQGEAAAAPSPVAAVATASTINRFPKRFPNELQQQRATVQIADS